MSISWFPNYKSHRQNFVQLGTAAVYPGSMEQIHVRLRLLEGCTSITINHPPSAPFNIKIRFSDSLSVHVYTPGWREALGESKVSLTKEQLTLNDLESDMLTTEPPIGSSETQTLN